MQSPTRGLSKCAICFWLVHGGFTCDNQKSFIEAESESLVVASVYILHVDILSYHPKRWIARRRRNGWQDSEQTDEK
jgi:hypothetical protein